MFSIHESDIEFLRVFLLGFIFGWIVRKYLIGTTEKVGCTLVKNIKYDFMNKKGP